MSINEKKLNLAIINYLKAKSNDLNDDNKESLEVAVQCLNEVLGVFSYTLLYTFVYYCLQPNR